MKYINEGMKIKVLDKYAEMKLLGVTFDKHLKFTSHLDELSKRISRKTGVLMRLQNLIPTLAKLRIYKSFILPQLTYCQTVWHTIVFLFLKKVIYYCTKVGEIASKLPLVSM